MLKERLLPRLAEASGAAAGPLWLHLANQLAAFEAALAPLRGLPAAAADEASSEAPLWAPGSCLEALTMQQVTLPPSAQGRSPAQPGLFMCKAGPLTGERPCSHNVDHLRAKSLLPGCLCTPGMSMCINRLHVRAQPTLHAGASGALLARALLRYPSTGCTAEGQPVEGRAIRSGRSI